jgi:hypothetical protein
MLYSDGRRKDHWGKGASVPDMSQLETRLWFLYLAAGYIDLGVEAIHFGQVEIMDNRDKQHIHWRDCKLTAQMCSFSGCLCQEFCTFLLRPVLPGALKTDRF